MNELIKKLLLEGKSDAEIAKAVLEANADKSAEEVTKAIISAKKEEDVIKALADAEKVKQDAIDAQKALDAKAQEKEAMKKEILESIQINPLGIKFGPQKELKSFNPVSGEIDLVKSDVSDAYGSFNAMLHCLMTGDKSNASAISREIDENNSEYRKEIANISLKKLEEHGIKAANDPSVSDVAARGGYSIPTEVDMMISQLIYAGSVMLANMNTDNIIYQSKIYPLMYGLTVEDIADQDTAVTESQPTFTNPTISMQRAGLFTHISNTLMRQKGADLVRSFTSATAGAFATFLDVRLAVGNVTSTGDLVDGIVFDTNTYLPTAIALNALKLSDLSSLIRDLSENASGEIVMIGNRKVIDTIGELEVTGGQKAFPQYINGGSIAPYGVPAKKNPKITSALDVGGDARTGGSDDVLLCYAKDYCIAGISGETRIDFSDQFRFTNDVTTLRAIKEYGSKVLSATGTGGIVAAALELTN